MAQIKLPPQKKRYRSKTKEWRRECVDAIDSGISYGTNQGVRDSVKEKYINARLYDGELTMSDVIDTINSAGVINAYIPKKIQNRPLIRPKIELLVGEAIKEPFDWSVMVTDPKSIAQKQENKKKLIDQQVNDLLKNQELTDEEVRTKLEEMGLYFKYTWKDIKEVRATKVLKYYYQKLNVPMLFSEAMLDRLVYGEEIALIDIVGEDVAISKLDPKKVHTLYSSSSNKISDADIIVIEEYWSVGKIVDTYYNYLKPEEIDRLNSGEVSEEYNDIYANTYTVVPNGFMLEGAISGAMDVDQYNGATVDEEGNYRVLRGMWRSQKLVYVVKGIDPETGEEYERVMSEEYTPNPLYGETVEKLWVEEWWHGVKIANDIYPFIEPKPVQFRMQGNYSKGHPGIIGRVNSVSGGKVVSFLSKMKPYQYLYNIVWERLLDAIKKDLGNIVEMDFAKKPAGWDVAKWLHYAYKGGIMFVDSFKEATKGAATGKLAGAFNTTGKTISTSNGNYIQQHVYLLEYIKKELSDIVGITPQREGMVQASATVGSTERSVMQSNNNTEWEFYNHREFKLEFMQVLLETAKVALRNNRKLAQNILDDFSLEVFDIDGDEFLDSDYSVFLTISNKALKMEDRLDAYAHAFMQNGGNFSTVLNILFSDSIAEKRRKIELAEEEMKKERQAEREQAVKLQQEKIAADKEEKDKERELERYKVDSDNMTKIYIEQMKQGGEMAKIESDSNLSAQELLIKAKELQEKIKPNKKSEG